MKIYKLFQALLTSGLIAMQSSSIWAQQAKNVVLASFRVPKLYMDNRLFPITPPPFRLATFGVGLTTVGNLPWSAWRAKPSLAPVWQWSK